MLRQVLLSMTILLGLPAAEAGSPTAFEGRQLYRSYCMLCHGAAGGGDGPLARSLEIEAADLRAGVRSQSDADLAWIITGRGARPAEAGERHRLPNVSMPEWKYVFDPAEVEALIAYLRFLSRNRHPLVGDPEAGAPLYRQYCAACHGNGGDGDGVMAGLLGVKPAAHADAKLIDAIDDRRMRASILDGRGRYMPAWRGILGEAEADALIAYIRLLAD